MAARNVDDKRQSDYEESMRKRAARALWLTWEVIGYDALDELAQGQQVSVNRTSMTRAEVIDLVTACGFVGGYPDSYGGDKEAVAWLEVQPEEAQNQVCLSAFKSERYGI